MQVKDYMTKDLVRIAPEESAAVAARLLARHNVGVLPVCSKEGRLRGVVTDRDIVLRCVAANEDASQVRVAEIMTRRVISVDSSVSLETAVGLMAREQVRRLPVADGGKLVGMVTLTDIAKAPHGSGEAAAALCEIASNISPR